MKRGVLYSAVEAEGRRKRNPFDTVTEGVGLNRLTRNFARAHIDDAVRCSDQVLPLLIVMYPAHTGLQYVLCLLLQDTAVCQQRPACWPSTGCAA